MDEEGFAHMNVIPLVDVMLVLFTIVLTTSTFIASGAVPVNLPRASSVGREALKSRTVEIDRAGQLYCDGRGTTPAGLRTVLAPLARATPILIRADRASELQRFVDVLDLVKAQGFTAVSLQTEKGR